MLYKVAEARIKSLEKGKIPQEDIPQYVGELIQMVRIFTYCEDRKVKNHEQDEQTKSNVPQTVLSDLTLLAINNKIPATCIVSKDFKNPFGIFDTNEEGREEVPLTEVVESFDYRRRPRNWDSAKTRIEENQK